MRRGLAWAGLTMAMTFGLADVASATYPGTNGKIYFSRSDPPDHLSDVWRVNPDGSGLENVTDTLTDGPGLPNGATMGGVSGDGSRLVVSVDGSADQEIWAIDADGSDPLRLTDNDDLESQPDISADGSRVVWSFRGPTDAIEEVWIMNADGTSKQKLVDNPPVIHPVFTPDGQTIVLTTDTGPSRDIGTAPAAPPAPPVTATDLISIDPTDEEFPSVSPDGQSVAFRQDPAGPFLVTPGNIFRVGIGGGATNPLTTSPPDVFSNAAYSPDGAKLAYITDGPALVVANADGSNPTPLPIAVPAGSSIGGSVRWAVGPATQPPPPPDTTAPETTIDKKPKKKSRKRKAVFRFSSNEDGATFQCRLDKKPFKPCTSPKKYRKLKPGKHKFRVFATDATGNAEASRNGVTFKVNDIKG